LTGITIHLLLRFAFRSDPFVSRIPLFVVLGLGGVPLIYDLARKALKRQFGSDLLAGISIVTSVLLGEYLAGSIVVLMLSGGEALEAYAIHSASSVLNALARRVPSVAHRKQDTILSDVPWIRFLRAKPWSCFLMKFVPLTARWSRDTGSWTNHILPVSRFVFPKRLAWRSFPGLSTGTMR
jgi:hypothetical protein